MQEVKNGLVIGASITRLRKKRGFTQTELAERLYVSNKTVSKWERGLGYPEITQLPALAHLLGTTVDHLLMGERHGIAIAGNILTDCVKQIDCYPEKGMLTNIQSISMAVGRMRSKLPMSLWIWRARVCFCTPYHVSVAVSFAASEAKKSRRLLQIFCR